MRRVLVLLVVLGLALALWFWPGPGEDPRHDFGAQVGRCKQNLRALHAALILYKEKFARAPEGSGVAFFAELIAQGLLPDGAESRALLTCPGEGAEPVSAGVDYHDLAALTPRASGYAGRDTARHPLAKFPSGGPELEPLIACDNARGMNHAGVMNVLYSDGSVVTLTLEQEIAGGVLPAGASTIPVGPSSPVADLRKLASD